MMGLLLLVLLVAIATAILWFAKVKGPVLKLAVASMLLASGGYALQGRPGLGGASPRGSGSQAPAVSLTPARHLFFGEFNASEHWLLLSESFSRRGKREEAAGVLENAVRKYPGDLPLWLGYANALVEQGGGLTPAARLAFERAEALSPGHPATRFFHGLAIARSGDPGAAVAMWREALATAPADARWRPLVEDGVAALSPQPAEQAR